GATPAVPAAVALLFSLALAAMLSSALSIARSTAAGLLAGSILLANQFLVNSAPDQSAALPLAFFGLGSAALLVLDRSARYLTLAGIFAGFAAWTKNEGLLLRVALALAILVTAARIEGIRQAGLFFAGALPVLLLVLWFKFFV